MICAHVKSGLSSEVSAHASSLICGAICLHVSSLNDTKASNTCINTTIFSSAYVHVFMLWKKNEGFVIYF